MSLGTDSCAALRAYMHSIGIKSLAHLKDPATVLARIIDEQDALRKPPRKKRVSTTAFTPPTPSEVEAYAKEIGYTINGQDWCDTYETKGWKTSGSTKMVSWKAALRKWKANGWTIGSNTAAPSRAQNASLGSLQFELNRIEKEMTDILYPGGCAWKTIPEGEKLVRFNELKATREGLLARIDEFSA